MLLYRAQTVMCGNTYNNVSKQHWVPSLVGHYQNSWLVGWLAVWLAGWLVDSLAGCDMLLTEKMLEHTNTCSCIVGDRMSPEDVHLLANTSLTCLTNRTD